MSEIPQTQVALQFVGADETRLNTEKPVPELGPTQILCKIEATGICFSDTKLLHAFTSHPRKSEVLTFLSADELAEIPSYVPGEAPTVPGHEACARVVAVGSEVKHHQVGDRRVAVLVGAVVAVASERQEDRRDQQDGEHAAADEAERFCRGCAAGIEFTRKLRNARVDIVCTQPPSASSCLTCKRLRTATRK